MAAPASHRAADAAAKVEEVVSPKGIRAYLIAEPAIPFMSVSMRFKSGSVADPSGKEGLANMVAALLDEGAGDLDSEAFRTELEDLAISLHFDAGRDAFSGSLKTLTEHRERAFELLGMALTRPRFDLEPIDRIRSQIQAGIRRRSEDPDYIASRTWFEHAFKDHAYSRPTEGTAASVAAIERDDLLAFVDQRLARDNLLIGVAGDIDPLALGRLLDQAFGDLPATSTKIEVEPTVPRAKGVVVVRKNLPQSKVVFGQEGLMRHDPDFYAAHVANHILGGGGFTSRLTSQIREERGLAYSVYSYLYPTDYAPLWMGGLGTGNISVSEALDIVKEQVGALGEGALGPEELQDAKTYLTGSFPLRLTSNDRIAQILVSMQADDLGIDYLDKRNSYIEAVTLADVKRVAARLFDPAALLTVIVGDPSGVESEVSH